MKRIVPIFLSLVLLLVLPLQTFAATIDDIKTIIQNDYVGEINGDLEKADTIDEIMEMLDPYSAYFTKEEYEAFTNSVDMTSVGIGVVIEKNEKGILIVDVVENGSAKKAGIVPGDIIISVDNQSTVNLSIEQTQSLMLGAENTTVNLKILKENGTIVSKKVTRQAFSLPNVNSALLYGNVGYIALSSFSEDGAQLVMDAYNQLVKQGATSFILDLQYNGGGYVSTAEELIGMFTNTPLAYKLKLSVGTYLERAVPQKVKFPTDTKVLVNRYSASASEMTAAALLDQQAAIIYGEQTFGKGTMQGFYELADGSFLKLTMGEFFGPRGTVVKNVGVTPNVITTDNPIFQAHYDSLVENLVNYEELPSLESVPTSKTFDIKLTKSAKEPISTDAVELVQLGGDKVDVTLEVEKNHIIVKPTKPLIAGLHYMLIIHPTIQVVGNQTIKTGKYLHITVNE